MTTAAPELKTITSDDASELYELLDWEHDTIGPERAGPNGWTLLGSSHSSTRRWHEWYWLLVRDGDGAVWGIAYGVGLTESQENELPWEERTGPFALTRLYPHEVTRTVYRREPADTSSAT